MNDDDDNVQAGMNKLARENCRNDGPMGGGFIPPDTLKVSMMMMMKVSMMMVMIRLMMMVRRRTMLRIFIFFVTTKSGRDPSIQIFRT